jgi:putative intracellular protease/amidase
MSSKGSILIVSTSHDKLGDTDKPTGCWVEELAVPYYTFKQAGYEVVVASISGGRIPFDPASLVKDTESQEYKFMETDDEAKAAWQNSKPISGMSMDQFAAIYIPGGHGIVFDGASSTLQKLLESAVASGKIVSSVCHGPGALVTAKGPDGKSILNNKKVTGFSNSEEDAVEKTQYVPFLLEDKLKELGGEYSKAAGDWQPHVVADGNLITGQNPGSSKGVAEAVLKQLGAA